MPSLKLRVESLEDLPEEVRSFYREASDGKGFILDAEEDPRVGEFRNSNRSQREELAKLRADLERFKGVDPERYKRAVAALEKFEGDEEREMLEKGEWEKVIERRVSGMRSDFDKQIAAKDKALEQRMAEVGELRSKLGSVLIDADLTKALNRAGVLHEGALPDALARGHGVFKLNEKGEVVPMKDGEVRYGKNGDLFTADEWASELIDTAGHLFKSTSGSGSSGDAGGTGDGSGRPASGKGGARAIRRDDASAFGDNLDGIISGETRVRP